MIQDVAHGRSQQRAMDVDGASCRDGAILHRSERRRGPLVAPTKSPIHPTCRRKGQSLGNDMMRAISVSSVHLLFSGCLVKFAR